MSSLRQKLIRLAHRHPGMQDALLPILKTSERLVPDPTAFRKALRHLRDAGEWGLEEEWEDDLFKDMVVTISRAKFIGNPQKSGWRMESGSFPGIDEPIMYLIEGHWEFEFKATSGGLYTQGTGREVWATEFEEDTYPDVWETAPRGD